MHIFPNLVTYSYPYKCTLTVMDTSITNNSKEHKFQFQKSMGKHFTKASSNNLAAELPSEHTRCKLQHLQNHCNLPTVCFPDFMYLAKQYPEICMLLYIQATLLLLQWMKNFSLNRKAAILSQRKGINKHVCCECNNAYLQCTVPIAILSDLCSILCMLLLN